jgi:hypothetical protein
MHENWAAGQQQPVARSHQKMVLLVQGEISKQRKEQINVQSRIQEYCLNL